MRLLLDNIVFDLQRNGGISVVWYELLKRLISRNFPGISYIDSGSLENYYRRKLQIDNKEVLVQIKIPKLSRYIPVSYNLNEPFLFHSSYYRYCTSPRAINITTVHDFTYEYFRKGMQKYVHSKQKFGSIRHSNYVVCISENTKRDLLKLMPDVDDDKVRVIYNGVSDDYFTLPNHYPILDTVPFKPYSYVIYVGDRSEYKNFPLCVRSVKESPYNLVIVGKELTPQESGFLSQILPDNRYYVTGFITNKELNILYNHAAGLVYPSIYEGFGIPVLEAQKAGCPVIAYNTSSIPEIIGSDFLLMEKLSTESLVSKLSLLGNQELMNEVRNRGIMSAKRFSWDEMADNYIKLYDEAIH